MRLVNLRTRGFSLVESLLVISILVALGSLTITGVLREIRQARITGAANELAAWLVAVRRSAERGIPCQVNIPNQTPIGNNDVATGSAVNPDNTKNTTIPGNCLQDSPLRFQSSQGQNISFAVTSSANQFFFSPRGTIHQDQSSSNLIDVGIRTFQNGIATASPAKHICIIAPLGLIRVSNTCEE